MSEEAELNFRRFSDDKQEQIRQLVSYCTLMGLTGKDLVSIGGKLDRLAKAEELKRNLEIGLSYPTTPVRNKKDNAEYQSKWYYTDTNNIKWKFECESSWRVMVTNTKSGRRQAFYTDVIVTKGRRYFKANVMANVHHGRITLNF